MGVEGFCIYTYMMELGRCKLTFVVQPQFFWISGCLFLPVSVFVLLCAGVGMPSAGEDARIARTYGLRLYPYISQECLIHRGLITSLPTPARSYQALDIAITIYPIGQLYLTLTLCGLRT